MSEGVVQCDATDTLLIPDGGTDESADSPAPLRRRLRGRDLLVVGCVVYLASRFAGLTRFPIYFFCDEAIQATLADGLLQNGFRDADGVLFPPYLRNDQQFNLSLSPYLQIPAVALFGPTVLGTRATSVLVGFLAVPAAALIMRLFGARSWWLAPFVLASIPAWFLHSRTAFEVAEMVGFYACFLAAYLMYRLRSPNYAAVAILFGGATFYSYANGQGLMLATGVLLLVSDARHHWAQRRRRPVVISAGVMTVLMALPYLREQRLHPSAASAHLRRLDSYWFRDLSLPEKLATFWRTYRRGLSPDYWFSPGESPDLVRHVMKGMGHVWWPLLPLVVIGIGVCLVNWRRSEHRLVLIALVSAPFSAAMVEVVVTRALVTVIPITILACLGIEQVVRWIRTPVWRTTWVGVVAVLLVGATFGMTRTALTDGPRWYDDYGLYGMQWGGPQVFGQIDELLDDDPALRAIVSTDWANNPNAFVPFFVDESRRSRVALRAVEEYLERRVPIDDGTVFVLSPDDHAVATSSGLLQVDRVIDVIELPDGRPGFHFVQLSYLPGADERFAAIRAERSRLVDEQVVIAGEDVTVSHPALDMGTIAAAFDGSVDSVARGAAANPFVLVLDYPTARPVATIELVTHRMDLDLTVVLLDADGEELGRSTTTHRDLPERPTVRVDAPVAADGSAIVASAVRLELRDAASQEFSHVHVYELIIG